MWSGKKKRNSEQLLLPLIGPIALSGLSNMEFSGRVSVLQQDDCPNVGGEVEFNNDLSISPDCPVIYVEENVQGITNIDL